MLVSFSPDWFYGYDVVLEFGFTIAALIIALFAFKIYRTTDQKQVRLFGIAFSLFAASYFVQSLLNLLIIAQADKVACGTLALQSVSLFGTYGLYAHMLFMTAGLSILSYMTFKTEKMMVLWLTLSLALIAIVYSISPLHTFFFISSVLLAIILWHYVANYLQTRQTTTLLVVLAFAFLLFGSLHFMLSVNHELYYVIGHFLELAAYLLILANLYLVLHGKKAR